MCKLINIHEHNFSKFMNEISDTLEWQYYWAKEIKVIVKVCENDVCYSQLCPTAPCIRLQG